MDNKNTLLRVLSFNVRMDLIPRKGELSEISKNRVSALCRQAQSYEPDLMGFQEDVTQWIINMDIDSEKYTVYRPDTEMRAHTMEYCSIYVKRGLDVCEHGWRWITSDGTDATTTLTYDMLCDKQSRYYMSDADRAQLGIVDNASLKKSYEADGIIARQGNLLAARLMNYVVLHINGKHIIYVNTHLQHRGYNGKPYEAHPVYMLRYFERSAQFGKVREQIEALKSKYAGAEVILTADFNDTSVSGFYCDVCRDFTDSMFAAKDGDKTENSWNACYKNDLQGQGYITQPSEAGFGRIDFCFVSSGLADKVKNYGVGAFGYTLEDGTHVYPSDHLPIFADIDIG